MTTLRIITLVLAAFGLLFVGGCLFGWWLFHSEASA